MRIRSLGAAAVLAAASTLFVTTGPAAATPPIDEAAPPLPAPFGFTPNDVVLGPRLLFRVRGGQGGAAANSARAEQARMRLLAALDTDAALIDAAAPGGTPAAEAVTVLQPVAGAPATLLVYGKPVITVDAALARANGAASPGALAERWAGRLRDALTSAKQRGTLLDPQRSVAGLPPAQQAPRVLPAPRVAKGNDR